MDGVVIRLTLSLIGPGTMLVFGLAFAAAWAIDRRRPYLLLIALTCVLFTLGAVCQILNWPGAIGLNALISGAFYTAAVLLLAQGVLLRSGREFPWFLFPIVLAVILVLIGYFFYFDRNLLARVYIQNFGYGLVLLCAALRLRSVPRNRPVDHILYWVLLLFALHFFPRTLLTIGFADPAGEGAFANSVFWPMLQLSLALLGVSLALAIFTAAFSDLLEDALHDRKVDALTGILNRHGLDEAVAARLKKPEGQTSVVLCDVDHFKRINDVYGHDVGDAVLRTLGQLLRESTRTNTIVGRFGGEEFLVLLSSAGVREATLCAERLRLDVASHHFPLLTGVEKVTASFGVAELRHGETWESLFKRADSCLYAAKRAGRNQTVAASAE